MKVLIFILLAATFSFGHTGKIRQPEDANISSDFGAFANISYRDEDIYPKGIERAQGYEDHGSPGEVYIEHLGIYYTKKIEKINFNFELNHHAWAEWTLNELVEKANIGYYDENYGLELGRDYNNVSFMREMIWGYGFIQMPLAIDSFFDQTNVGDGVFASYKIDRFTFRGDYAADQYAHKLRKTIRASYEYDTIKLISYYQQRSPVKNRVDFSAITHSHTHGSGCDQMTQNELCMDNETSVFGLGTKVKLNNSYELVGEYIQYKSEGDIETQQYKVSQNNTIHSTYLQLMSTNEKFNYGLRGEYFWYNTILDGPGATEVSSLMSLNTAIVPVNYLYTANINYYFTKSQKIAFEIKKSNQDLAMRLNYSLDFRNIFKSY
ncbi:MAG TPA: hypothetical protein PLC57_09435, partial [Sulfurovum sp.]|nr:hypothetical protein [Sulfurovum sp.]